MTTEPTVPVTQDDREAAADLLLARGMGRVDAKRIRNGENDRHHVVQAFARHRIAAEQSRASTPAVGREAGINAVQPHAGRSCYGCGSLEVAHIIDGDPLCMTCCHKWARGEGQANDTL